MFSLLARETTYSPEEIQHISPYGYFPNYGVGVLFVILFASVSFCHLIVALYRRAWYMLPTAVLCGLLEILGWAGRVWAAKNVNNNNAFMIQITCTIIAPTPLVALSFIVFGRLIRRLGTVYSFLKPRVYTILFLSCDLIALVVQGGGGGLASSAKKEKSVNLGSNIMLAGIIFQVVVILCFVTLTFLYWRRYRNDLPINRPMDDSSTPRGKADFRLQLLIYALALNTTCLFIRAIYRTVELATGWHGIVMRTEWLFCVFDGAMIVAAMAIFLFLHPDFLLQPPATSASSEENLLKTF